MKQKYIPVFAQEQYIDDERVPHTIPYQRIQRGGTQCKRYGQHF